jgi:hypothetical protein
VSHPRDLRGTFRAVVDALHEAGVAHAFIGALPVLAWGRVRATADIDLVVLAHPGWERLVGALEKRNVRLGKQVGPADSADRLPDIAVFYTLDQPTTRVDVFVAKTDFERAVIAGARGSRVLDANVRVAAPEASIIYKLLAQRRRDLDDIESIFEARRAARDKLDWHFLEYWADEWGIGDRLAEYKAKYAP